MKKKEFVINARANSGGMVSPAGKIIRTENQSLWLTASPLDGFYIERIEINQGVVEIPKDQIIKLEKIGNDMDVEVWFSNKRKNTGEQG